VQPASHFDGLVKPVVEEQAVGQACQGIVVRQMIQSFFNDVNFTDVGEGNHKITDMPARIPDHTQALPGREVFSAASLADDFALPVAILTGREFCKKKFAVTPGALNPQQDVRIETKSLAFAVTRYSRKRGIDGRNAAVRAGDNDGFCRGVEDDT